MQTIMILGSAAIASAVLEKILGALNRMDLAEWLKFVTIALMSSCAIKLVLDLLAILGGMLIV